MEQFCKEHSQFKPCQLCAKEDIWQGETLIFKRDALKRISELEQENERLRGALGKIIKRVHGHSAEDVKEIAQKALF